MNIAASDSSQVTRYRFEDHEVADFNVGSDATDVLQLAKVALELKLSSDSLSGYVTLPIARVIEINDEGRGGDPR